MKNAAHLLLVFAMALFATSMLRASAFNYAEAKAEGNANTDSLFRQAVLANNAAEVSRLLAAGADPNVPFPTSMKETPLMYASAFKDGKLLRMLLNAKARVNDTDINGDHALNWAAYYGHTANMRQLMRAGADVSLRSKHGDALDVAFRLWHADSVIDVFRGSKLETKIAANTRLFLKEVKNGNLAKVTSLLAKGADPNSRDGLGMSALHIATTSANPGMVKLLLEQKADANILNRVGQSPLTIAARFGNADIMKLLMSYGADANHAGETYALTPLIGAAVNGDPELIGVLLDAGAAIDHQDVVNDCTALHWSIFYNNVDASRLLLDKGADFTLKCLDDEYTGYTLAAAYDNKAVKRHMEALRAASNPLEGSWKLQEIYYEYTDTTYHVKAWQGSLLVGKSRYSIMYNPSSRPRKAFASLSKPTEEETIAGFRSIVFNSGPYEILDDVLIATPDIAKVPGFEGGKQYYRFSVQGEQLEYRLFDETYPGGEKPEWYGQLEIRFVFIKE